MNNSEVSLVGITSPELEIDGKKLSPEEMIAYCARVSNPGNQNNTATMPKLLKFLRDNKHWSPFEMVSATLEINTSRAISQQILRHRSFSFQEFSSRYAAVDSSGVVIYAARRQDSKNRQNSIDDIADPIKEEWESRQLKNWQQSFEHYTWALDNGIAKECARMVLPLNTKTRIYMAGTIRSWIHFLDVRCDKSTQLEHRDIANACREVLAIHFPNTFTT